MNRDAFEPGPWYSYPWWKKALLWLRYRLPWMIAAPYFGVRYWWHFHWTLSSYPLDEYGEKQGPAHKGDDPGVHDDCCWIAVRPGFAFKELQWPHEDSRMGRWYRMKVEASR